MCCEQLEIVSILWKDFGELRELTHQLVVERTAKIFFSQVAGLLLFCLSASKLQLFKNPCIVRVKSFKKAGFTGAGKHK